MVVQLKFPKVVLTSVNMEKASIGVLGAPCSCTQNIATLSSVPPEWIVLFSQEWHGAGSARFKTASALWAPGHRGE